ncbi:GtrA family protein [Selenomonas ruminantium]|uniref:Putative flippase GtrA (Transmembrane translocase of bactoprenol-linked glucose) n=1 Tax=Selenomonas ruminantium TaxID=971 RepID=A0A1H4A9X2_SELRU|nr:GtrA family protein [Selenomonas ruminantium]SEA32481.1 Putative flippase GtrA (transmembrane translocase of bactoprenol-linked glucose) [Selenomonas ruminantium]
MQFVKFCIIGISNALVYYFTYAGGLYAFRENSILTDFDYLVAHIIGFSFCVYWGFCINRRFVFNEGKVEYAKSLLRFYIIYTFTGFILNAILLYLWNRVGISAYIAPIINVIFTTPINFIMSKLWAFGEKI